jgi:hypothetical protein
MARIHGTRQDTWVVRVHLNGNTTGIWDKRTGGELDSEETKYPPGGMQPPVSLGGRKTPGNVVLQRLYDRVEDHGMLQDWYNAVGHGKVDVFSRPMDFEGEGFGQAILHTGTLKRVSVPDVDSESSSAALIEIEVAIGPDPKLVASPGS